jgi:hypothetical protein
MKDLHFGASLRAFLPDAAGERKFEELEKRLKPAIQGK